jgi:FixJ family two-component response regulator
VSGARELVCAVDDDPSVRRGLRRLFKSAGYAAETFASAEDYLAREIFQGSICLVLDVRMPGLKGPGLQEALEKRGACEQIVFLTGHGDVPTATRAMKEGAVDFLTKPPREFEVLRFVVIGLLNKQIAAELHTAEKTIKVHRGRVMQKLGVTSVPDLIRISQRAGVSPPRNPA